MILYLSVFVSIYHGGGAGGSSPEVQEAEKKTGTYKLLFF